MELMRVIRAVSKKRVFFSRGIIEAREWIRSPRERMFRNRVELGVQHL